ncbi:MAG: AAA family ATPase [Actinomycetota bacterium]|nr:AAA family ATPase [Actinomycetota bacterium]
MERPAPAPSTVGEAALLERVAFSQALAESLASVAAGEGRVVLVSGEAGIGKSALVRSFCDAHRDAARGNRGRGRAHLVRARPRGLFSVRA